MMNKNLHYNYAECRELAKSAPRNDPCFTKACAYFHDRVFHVGTSIFYYNHGTLTRTTFEDFKKNHMTGFDAKFKAQILETIVPYEEVLETEAYDVDKERKKLNILKPLYASTLKDIKVTDAGLQYVEFVKKFILEILARDNEAKYNVLLRWCASVLKMIRTGICPVLVTSTEGVGKTTFAMIMQALVGHFNTARPSAEEIKRFNWNCYGKLLVVFEETESLRSGGGAAVNDNLKNMINSDRVTYEQKCVTSHDNLLNVNNFIVTSNFPLPNSSGRRYLNLTLSTKWLGKDEYFNKLRNFSDENIKALYDFFMTVDVSNWNAESAVRSMDTEEPNLKAIESMNNAFRYMRDVYAVRKTSEKIKRGVLYSNYKDIAGCKAYQKSTFYEKVAELNIKVTITQGVYYFVIDGNALHEEFKKRRLFDEDDGEENTNTNKPAFAIVKEEDPRVEQLENENAQMKKELAELKKKLEEMQQMQENNKPEPEIGTKRIKITACVVKR